MNTRQNKQRALYIRDESLEDCHVPRDFFSNMTINANLRVSSLWSILNSTLPVVHQVLIVILFVCSQYDVLFRPIHRVDHTKRPPPSVILVVVFSLFTNFGTFVILSLLVYILSPVIQTLTVTFSDDTIFSTSIISFVLHLYSFDYSYFVPSEEGTNVAEKPLDSALSLSCIFIPLILLGSRCSSPLQFFYLFLNMHFLFLGILPLRRILYYQTQKRLWLQITHWTVIVIGIAGSILVLLNYHAPFSQLLVLTIGDASTVHVAAKLSVIAVASVVTCDIVYYFLQKYTKRRVSGPWDEAKIVL